MEFRAQSYAGGSEGDGRKESEKPQKSQKPNMAIISSSPRL